MNTKFKRHQSVKLLVDANPEFVEYRDEFEDTSKPLIKRGMKGRINILLSNGKYHVEILNDKNEVIAYAPFSEEDLEEAD